jgi:chemotaxis family two-component system sensor kinase Cph1
VTTETAFTVTLENCDHEPIHIPGHIQPHGALFAFDLNQVLCYRSANARALLGESVPELGEVLSPRHFAPYAHVHELIAQVRQTEGDVIPYASETGAGDRLFDVVVHRTDSGFTCEFEDRLGAVPAGDNFAFAAHRAAERLKRQTSVGRLLQVAVEELRKLTGFDRVMAYRFRHDDSGEVAAEAVSELLVPFLGQRYPAGDIPAQARRLYVINTLRLIADVGAKPVPIEVAALTTGPLDMSHGVLRSVSPVHIEYLGNMGVSASMSVSIVIGGKLWGLLACHHMGPRRVASQVRMACDVLGQILASNLQGALASERAALVDAAASMRLRIVEQVLHADDIIAALASEAHALCSAFSADGVLVWGGGKLQTLGDVSPATSHALVQWLVSNSTPGSLVQMNSISALPAEVHQQVGVWRGLLALPFGQDSDSLLVLLRKEEIETVLWGGKPDKNITVGPLGPRLTPRGSFELWREIVRDQAIPWSPADLESAQKLLDELIRADTIHQLKVSTARNQLLAMLGHDLRDPLQSISNTATLLEKSGVDHKVSRRLQSSSVRMQRLVDQVMDMSMLSGGGMHFNIQRCDLVPAVTHLVSEIRSAYPDMKLTTLLPAQVMADVDTDRMSQVIGNLLSNAGHHGTRDEAVVFELSLNKGMVTIEVSNTGPAIASELVPTLFAPFKRIASRSPTNRNGLGLGLYIAGQIMAGHGGELSYEHAPPYVIFTASFPADQATDSDGKRPING